MVTIIVIIVYDIKDFDFVYLAAGPKGTALKIEPLSIQGLTNAEWVDVCEE
ncbi:hypothetical protein [Clostridium muellerianum]|uniref:hypothetical protein n=1 Tax=Clostridium muellerianum TaxID=2716538 RepID=UPI001FACC669|nr:hypothetical protein [Clostridium muellerianum]